jgi:hypothetical protein
MNNANEEKSSQERKNSLKGQSHEKLDEIVTWNDSFGLN